VQGVFRLDPSDVAAFLEGRREGVVRSRAEPGCEEYVFCADPLEPGRVVLSERWATRADLDTHLGVLAATPPADGGPELLSREVVFYEATPFQPAHPSELGA
jgi:quinol monooxygenase YgiN